MADKEEKLSASKSEPEEELPEEIEAMLEDMESLPSNKKKLVTRQVVRETFAMMGIGQRSQESEVAKKINEKHISEYLEGAREQMRNEYRERHEKKIFAGIIISLALVFFVVIVVLLKENPDLLENVICTVGGLLAGAFGGYGLGKNKQDSGD